MRTKTPYSILVSPYAKSTGHGAALKVLMTLVCLLYKCNKLQLALTVLHTICRSCHCDDSLSCLSGTCQGADLHTNNFCRRHFSGAGSCQGGYLQGCRHRGSFCCTPCTLHGCNAALSCPRSCPRSAASAWYNKTSQNPICNFLFVKRQRTCATTSAQLMVQSELLQQPHHPKALAPHLQQLPTPLMTQELMPLHGVGP